MSTNLQIVLREWEPCPRRNQDLQMNEVKSSDQLRHRMLHLQPSVHLQKVELAVLINQKFDSSRVVVSSPACKGHSSLTHRLPHPGIDYGRWRFFDYFLMASLYRALTLAEIHHVAVLVAENLNLNMTRLLDQLLDIYSAIAKGSKRLALRGGQSRG